MPEIHLVLTDDWELRGDGSGHMPSLQFDTMERLLAIYERHGLTATFTVEVMQQLRHLEEGRRRPALLDLARRWEDRVRDAFRRGHDIQLHVHPQWDGAAWVDDRFKLDAPWLLTEHTSDRARAMVRDCREYLERLLRPIDPGYRCVAFRAGSWSIAPGEHVLSALIENGILLDISLVGGIRYENEVVRLDYRALDEEFLPFYPDLRDARRMSRSPQPIICLPTHTFDYTPVAKLRHLALRRASRIPWAGRLFADWASRASPDSVPVGGGADTYTVWRQAPGNDSAPGNGSAPAGWLRRTLAYYRERHHYISSLALLSYPMMREMLRDIRRRAAASGWARVPVVLENHTKDIGYFEPIERFAAYLARQRDVRVVPLGRVARDLAAGTYPVLTSRAA